MLFRSYFSTYIMSLYLPRRTSTPEIYEILVYLVHSEVLRPHRNAKHYSEEEEEVMELAWQLKKMEVKLLELGREVFNFQRKVEELQVAVNNLQFSVDTKL